MLSAARAENAPPIDAVKRATVSKVEIFSLHLPTIYVFLLHSYVTIIKFKSKQIISRFQKMYCW